MKFIQRGVDETNGAKRSADNDTRKQHNDAWASITSLGFSLLLMRQQSGDGVCKRARATWTGRNVGQG